MKLEILIPLIFNLILSIASIFGNILISYISNKDNNLEEKYKFKRYLSKEYIKLKDDNWIEQKINSQEFSNYCKRTQKYIIKRYTNIIKDKNKCQ